MRQVMIRGSLACAMVFAIAACGDRPGAESPTVNAAPVNDGSEPAQPSGPATIATVLAGGTGGLQGVDAKPLDEIQQGMSCSLDSVNGAAPASAPVVRGEPLRLSGWFQHAATGNHKVIAVLRAETAYAFPLVVQGARPDVAAVIGTDEAVADIAGTADTANVAPGEYAVYFVRGGDSGTAKCLADKKIIVE